MKYSQWNDLLFEYYFLEDKGHQVFLGLDKDTLVDYVIDKGCFNDVVDRVQQATPNRVIKPEDTSGTTSLHFQRQEWNQHKGFASRAVQGEIE